MKYTVLDTPFQYRRRIYTPGEVVEMAESEAVGAIANGVLTPVCEISDPPLVKPSETLEMVDPEEPVQPKKTTRKPATSEVKPNV